MLWFIAWSLDIEFQLIIKFSRLVKSQFLWWVNLIRGPFPFPSYFSSHVNHSLFFFSCISASESHLKVVKDLGSFLWTSAPLNYPLQALLTFQFLSFQHVQLVYLSAGNSGEQQRHSWHLWVGISVLWNIGLNWLLFTHPLMFALFLW